VVGNAYIRTIQKARIARHMDKVIASMRAKCNMDAHGGRFCHTGLRECLVYDVEEFSETAWTELKAEFPRLQIDVLCEPTSLSGFAIRLRLVTSHHQRVIVTGALLAAMCAVVAHCLSA
jgi:hypothetical protein